MKTIGDTELLDVVLQTIKKEYGQREGKKDVEISYDHFVKASNLVIRLYWGLDNREVFRQIKITTDKEARKDNRGYYFVLSFYKDDLNYTKIFCLDYKVDFIRKFKGNYTEGTLPLHSHLIDLLMMIEKTFGYRPYSRFIDV